MNRQITLQYYRKRIKRALTYIEQHLDEDIALDVLAEVTHFSPYHFHRVFTGIVGESVKNYVRRLKLERAAYQLLRTKQTVTAIAVAAGYESVAAFSRVFREKFKTNPQRFRVEKREIKLAKIKYSGVKNMQVTIKNVPKLRVATVRHVGPYMECGPAFAKLFSNVPCGPTSKVLGICYVDPVITAPDKIRYDACLSVEQNYQPTIDGIEIKEVFGGKYAVTIHKGAYANLYKTYETLIGKWIPQNGYKLRPEPPLEMYLNDPQTTKPEDLLTEIYVPLLK